MIKNLRYILLLIFAASLGITGCNPGIVDVPAPQVTDASAYFWPKNSVISFDLIDSVTGKPSVISLGFFSDSSTGVIKESSGGIADSLFSNSGNDEVSISGISRHSIVPLPDGYSIKTENTLTQHTFTPPVSHIISIPNTTTVVAATESNGVFFSDDGGLSWQKSTSQTFGDNNPITCFAVVNGMIYAGTYQGTLFYSTDGSVWSPAGSYASGRPIVALASNPLSDALYVSIGDSVYRTTQPRAAKGGQLVSKRPVNITTMAFIVGDNDSNQRSEFLFGGNYRSGTGTLLSWEWPSGHDWTMAELTQPNFVSSLLATSGQRVYCSADSAVFFCDTLRKWTRISLTDIGNGILAYDYGSQSNRNTLVEAGGRFLVLDEFAKLSGSSPSTFSKSVIHDITVVNSKYLLATDLGVYSNYYNTSTWDPSSLNLSSTRMDSISIPGKIVLLRSRSGSVALDSSWEACTLFSNQNLNVPIPITGRIIGHLDSLTIGTKSYSDVLAVRYAAELTANSLAPHPYWVIYFGRSAGPLIISQMIGTRTLSRAIRQN
ncbi:MAG: hypothetical protein Q8896_06210 [Bacteroidota bacterium]|nr:hypothetical protein [Bacteroidota bacterium]